MAQNDVNIKINVDATQAEQQTVNVRKRMRELMDTMTQLQLQGKEGTAAYASAAKELGKLKDAMGDTAAQARILSDDFFKQRAAMEGLSVGLNIFSGLSQAAALCGVENTALTETLTKLQAAQNLANVAMNIAKALNKDTALMTALRSLSTKELNTQIEAEAINEGKATASTNMFNTAQKTATVTTKGLTLSLKGVGTAIKSIPVIGWIAAAVSALIALKSKLDEVREEQKEAYEESTKKYKEYQDKVNSTAAQTITKFELLSQKYSDLGDNIDAKNKFIKDNKKAFDELGLSITGVKDAEDTLINNKEAFIAAEMAKAQASAAREAAADLMKQIIDERKTLEEQKKLAETMQAVWASQGMNQYDIDKNLKSYNNAINETQQNISGLESQVRSLFETIEIGTENGGSGDGGEVVSSVNERAKAIENFNRQLDRLLETEDEASKISSKYNDLVAEATRLFGAESEQVKILNQLEAGELKALNDKNKLLEKQKELSEEVVKAETNTLKIGLTDKEKLDAEINLLNARKDLELSNTELTEAEKLNITAKYEAQIYQLRTDYAKKLEEEEKARQDRENEEAIKKWKARYTLMEGIVSSFADFTSALQDAELEKVGDNQKHQADIRKKYAKMNFLSQIASIGIDTAKGIMSVWSTAGEAGPILGPILGAIQTAMIAGIGVAQTVKAKNAMNKALSGKAARGAFVTGRSHSQGGELYELEGGEAVLNKKAMAIPSFRALASAMNESTGGVSFTGSMTGASTSSSALKADIPEDTIRMIVSDTVSAVTAIPVVVTESSITSAQRNVSVLQRRATF